MVGCSFPAFESIHLNVLSLAHTDDPAAQVITYIDRLTTAKRTIDRRIEELGGGNVSLASHTP